MKQKVGIILAFLAFFAFVFCPNCKKEMAYADEKTEPVMAIIIDDFGGYERGGVSEMLEINVPLTCAVIPFVEHTKEDSEMAIKNGHEVILHMPMESHVNLPQSWYGPVYVKNYDTIKQATEKIDDCLKELPMAKGVNIHIGSGVSRNANLMAGIIAHLKERDIYFCDSRTHPDTKCEEACRMCNAPYLYRDVFLEPHGMKSYASAVRFLKEGASIALKRGYSVAIGHVGREGGKDTALAIKNTIKEIEDMGVRIVPLSVVNERIKNNIV